MIMINLYLYICKVLSDDVSIHYLLTFTKRILCFDLGHYCIIMKHLLF